MTSLQKSRQEFFTALGKRGAVIRWAGKTAEDKSATAQHASRAYWDSLSPEERSAEMKKRAAKRKMKGESKSAKR